MAMVCSFDGECVCKCVTRWSKMEKKHFVWANYSFYSQHGAHTRTTKNKTKMALSKWKKVYASKEIKFSVAFFLIRVFFSFTFDFALFNINYILCVMPRCAIYLVVAFFLHLFLLMPFQSFSIYFYWTIASFTVWFLIACTF